MGRSGFSLIEMLMVVILIGIVASLGFPRIRTAVQKTNVRSARVFLASATATARAAAVQRGCGAVVHFTSGANGLVWVTACPRMKAGAGTVDTLGAVEKLAARYSVTLTPTRDSIRFSPRGLNLDYQVTIIRVQGASTAVKDSTMINQIGKVVH
jgi:prepilin-type N-terminal cleavage/methylation domain-containing protein